MKRGVPFNFTLDYSHAIFKINNSEELDVAGIREDAESGRLVLDPFETGNLCDEWLSMGIVRWVQVRSVAPNGPRNVWSLFDPDLEVAAGPGCIGGMYKAGRARSQYPLSLHQASPRGMAFALACVQAGARQSR